MSDPTPESLAPLRERINDLIAGPCLVKVGPRQYITNTEAILAEIDAHVAKQTAAEAASWEAAVKQISSNYEGLLNAHANAYSALRAKADAMAKAIEAMLTWDYTEMSVSFQQDITAFHTVLAAYRALSPAGDTK